MRIRHYSFLCEIFIHLSVQSAFYGVYLALIKVNVIKPKITKFFVF
nr:MAG TPA_asm: hypothetical protein [Caudoviricetes sp.]